MTDQSDTKILEILGRQIRQDPLVDLVVPECWDIALKAQVLQPRRDVHAVILGSEERQPPLVDDRPLPHGLPAAALK